MPTYTTGWKELDRALNELPNAVAKRVLENTLKEAAKPMLTTAKANALAFNKPGIFVTGQLSRSIKIGTTVKNGGGRISGRKLNPGTGTIYLGPTYPMGAHGHFKEFGTSKQAAEPFLRPAWDIHQGELLKNVGHLLWKHLEKEAKRQYQKAVRFLQKVA